MKKKYKPLLSRTEKKIKFRRKLMSVLSILLAISLFLNYALINKIHIPFLSDFIDAEKKDAIEDIINEINPVLPVSVKLNFSDELEMPSVDFVEEDDDGTQVEIICDGNENSQVDALEDENDKAYLKYLATNREDIYRIIVEQMEAFSPTIIVTYERDHYLFEEFNEEFIKVLRDRPEFFWTKGGGHWDENKNTYEDHKYIEYTLNINFICEYDTIAEKYAELNLIADSIASDAQNYDTDYEKAKYVHDYIVDNTSYDEEGYYASQHNGVYDELMYSAYGNLVNKKSVCEGYAEAFKLIMNKLGIDCGLVTGVGITSQGNGAHGWNYVRIDDEYYYVDVTWDDPTYPEDYKPEGIRYDYFLINYEQICKDHIFDSDQEIPECTSTKYMNMGE